MRCMPVKCEKSLFLVNCSVHGKKDDLEQIVDNLHPTNDRESSEESHGASNS